MGDKAKLKRWHRLRNVLGQALVLLCLLLAMEAFLGREMMGVNAPAIGGITLSGSAVSVQDFHGQPYVVHFWASWCPVCELEQGSIDSLAEQVPLITVAMQSGTDDEVRRYMASQGVDYQVLNDERGLLAARYGVKAVPASFVVDGSGVIRFATRGYTTGWGLRMRLWLARLFQVTGE